MSIPLPSTSTSPPPMPLLSVTHNAVPDDSSFDSQPEGQVDYLSHNWREEDVWRSWRSMTRQKNAIANGMRLENASWRTWWKQRNGLKTISPETLNWLKDSDVTWLYGPLHIGRDWTVYSQHKNPRLHAGQRKTSTDALPGPYKTNSTASQTAAPMKPILKRRSTSQLLSFPANHFFLQSDSDACDEDDDSREGDRTRSSAPPPVHTPSDMRGRSFRQNDPAISHNGPRHPSLQTTTSSSEASGSAESERDLSSSSKQSQGGHTKKHISFNTFVEVCVAIEKPKLRRASASPPCDGTISDTYDDEYDSETGCDGEYDEPTSNYYYNHAAGFESDSEDDDDDVLEMRTASSRSHSNSTSSVRPTPLDPEATAPGLRPPVARRLSTDREHVSIALIAPTLLNSTGVGNEFAILPEGSALESPEDVDLVYIPTASYSLSSNEDVYHEESCLGVGSRSTFTYPRSPLPRSPAPGSSPQVSSVDLAPEGVSESMRRTSSGIFFPTQDIVDSPMHIDDMPPQDNVYDYFGGPDLGEDGAAGVAIGRSGSWRRSPRSTSPSPTGSPKAPSLDMPLVVVNKVTDAVEERQERARESSSSRSPVLDRLPEQQASPAYDSASLPSTPVSCYSPASTLVVASTSSNSNLTTLPSSAPITSVCADPLLLSPSDGMPTRGRMPRSPSVGGSTTTGSSTYHSSYSRSRSGSSSRGRSSTRTSSLSDCERSRSRSRGRGTSSPIGSISPTGRAIEIANESGRCRDRQREHESRASRSPRVGGGEEERGRERTGRRLGNSSSPLGVVSSPSRGSSSDGGSYRRQPRSLVLKEPSLEIEICERMPSSPSSVSGSSTETASVSTIGPSQA
ncbi:hypothetical protein L226DRAFT_107826 [Lentinus tigrinus ALCF2SS1-7]|uniref:Nitrogen regulatory protein areA GATA-like domain-containing protein n=1 Tax=Lentinus tigrinus ALCF2SS1-6 TaxID=1328759 RepID=A0A5C2S5G0_9APHY|nr:hypothetical protein L227DRAFT_171705 [Lentinus tigrinus ALCF2SS1-6]RPD73310.1 hypothetical protein L226DRAFT_107826 [Lentinus tigrinus ALCF2SS1-7]